MLDPHSPNRLQQVDEAYLQAERIRQVRILLDHMFSHEETTVKLILGYLYDVGSVNLINQKFRRRFLNRFMRMVAGLSKPIFRVVALRWFKKNCPQLITDWLQSQVSFAVAEVTSEQEPIALAAVETVAIAELETCNRQIRSLHRQVRWLAGVLVITTVTLGSAVVWLSYKPRLASAQAQPLQTSPIEDVRDRAEILCR